MSHDRIDKIAEDVSELKTGQARMEVHVGEIKEDLKYHIKRTDLAEERIYRLEKKEQWLRGATWIALGLGALTLSIIRLLN